MTAPVLFVTCALPYANGPLHLGHLVGYVQADVWVRAQRMQGREVRFVCADDAHGTPIMLAAEAAGETPERFIRRIQESHERDFAEFLVAFDHYHSTHSEENRELAAFVFERLKAAGLIRRERIRQLFDPERQMFLPDRYVRGECPRCGATDQYGDNCEVCGATYSPTELKNPRSALSGAIPKLQESEHLFFRLSACEPFLRRWLAGEVAHPAVRAKLMEWVEQGLRDWDITRDPPYFGFPIPGEKDKFFYVWLDAPIGYLASLKALCRRTGEDFAPYLDPASPIEMHHFLGKDIVNFHGLFWPAMLHGAGLKTPSRLHVNGYLTVDGAKMSKSRGTFILARTYLDCGLPPEALRYYLATRLGPGWRTSTSTSRTSRSASTPIWSANSSTSPPARRPCSAAPRSRSARRRARARPRARRASVLKFSGSMPSPNFEGVFPDYSAGEYGRALRRIMSVADRVNEYFAAEAPWRLLQQASAREDLRLILGTALQSFRALAIALAPVLPDTARRVAALFRETPAWRASEIGRWLAPRELAPYEPLWTRIEAANIAAMQERSREPSGTQAAPERQSSTPAATLGDFERIELRVARIIAAERVEGADRLLKLRLDVGPLGERTVFAGIRAAYPDPERLRDRLVILVANLEPRRMRFGVSEGMVLAASEEGGLPRLLTVDDGAKPGMRVR